MHGPWLSSGWLEHKSWKGRSFWVEIDFWENICKLEIILLRLSATLLGSLNSSPLKSQHSKLQVRRNIGLVYVMNSKLIYRVKRNWVIRQIECIDQDGLVCERTHALATDLLLAKLYIVKIFPVAKVRHASVCTQEWHGKTTLLTWSRQSPRKTDSEAQTD